MTILSIFKSTLNSLSQSVKRFTVPLIFSTGIFAVLITISQQNIKSNYNASTDILERLAMSLFIGLLATLLVDLYFENNKSLPLYYKFISYGLSILLVISFYFYIIQDLSYISTSKYAGMVVALSLMAFVIPNINKVSRIENYSINIIGRLFVTYIYALVLSLGVNAIFLTLDKLLNVPVYSELYYYVFLFASLIFAPAFFLGGIPADSKDFKSYKYPYFLRILILYIIMPLSAVYLSILYVYFGKIIITRTWPIGLVSHLVIWFCILCVTTMFFTKPIKDNKWAYNFRKYVPVLLIPILGMMFISMGIRIKHYGITEHRYYVSLLGIWILSSMIYFIFSKNANSKNLLISLSILCVVSVFGPVNSFSISKKSQNKRFDLMVAADNQREINNILTYFDEKHSLKDVNALPSDFKFSQMKEVFGFEYERYNNYINDNMFFEIEQVPQIINTKDYDYYIKPNMGDQDIQMDNLLISFNNPQGLMDIYVDDSLVYTFDSSEFITKLSEKHPGGNMIPLEDMSFTVDNDFIEAKFIFNYLGGTKRSDLVTFDHGDFILLIKLD